jgi:hypothetical protein
MGQSKRLTARGSIDAFYYDMMFTNWILSNCAAWKTLRPILQPHIDKDIEALAQRARWKAENVFGDVYQQWLNEQTRPTTLFYPPAFALCTLPEIRVSNSV